MRNILHSYCRREGYNMTSSYSQEDDCAKIPFACVRGELDNVKKNNICLCAYFEKSIFCSITSAPSFIHKNNIFVYVFI